MVRLSLDASKFHGDPAYSPDGAQISFDEDSGPGQPAVHGIFVANRDGSGAHRLTTASRADRIVVLDQGRKVRLHTEAQRIAMAARDKTCTAEGCEIPAAWCHAHHVIHWIDGGATYNFVTTNDIIGGNSGSPVINRAGEIVGLNFDSNNQKLSNRYWYIEEAEGSRAVGVHTAGILEALRKIYDAPELVKELTN